MQRARTFGMLHTVASSVGMGRSSRRGSMRLLALLHGGLEGASQLMVVGIGLVAAEERLRCNVPQAQLARRTALAIPRLLALAGISVTTVSRKAPEAVRACLTFSPTPQAKKTFLKETIHLREDKISLRSHLHTSIKPARQWRCCISVSRQYVW